MRSYATLGDGAAAMAADFYRRLFEPSPAPVTCSPTGPDVMAVKFSAELAAIVEAITSYETFAPRVQRAGRSPRAVRGADRSTTAPSVKPCIGALAAHLERMRGTTIRGGVAAGLQPGRRDDDGHRRPGGQLAPDLRPSITDRHGASQLTPRLDPAGSSCLEACSMPTSIALAMTPHAAVHASRTSE